MESELKTDEACLLSLKRLYIAVQIQKQDLNSEHPDFDMIAYNKSKKEIDEKYNSLQNTLADISRKAKNIVLDI